MFLTSLKIVKKLTLTWGLSLYVGKILESVQHHATKLVSTTRDKTNEEHNAMLKNYRASSCKLFEFLNWISTLESHSYENKDTIGGFSKVTNSKPNWIYIGGIISSLSGNKM